MGGIDAVSNMTPRLDVSMTSADAAAGHVPVMLQTPWGSLQFRNTALAAVDLYGVMHRTAAELAQPGKADA